MRARIRASDAKNIDAPRAGGLVREDRALIDSATPYQFDIADYRSFYWKFKRALALLPLAARTVMGRIALRSGFGSLPPRARDAARTFNSSPRQLTASRIEFLQLPTVFNRRRLFATFTASRSPS